MKTPAILFAAMAALIAPALAKDWRHRDFAAAQAQAQAENKPMVLDFTGSDWCVWCITLHKQVLDTPAFYAYARDKFVLVEVDLPHNTAGMPDTLIQQNNELLKRYKVDTFPTVLVLTPQGRLLGGFVGGRTELAAVTQPLELALENARLLQQAETQTGTDKAQTLKAFYWNIPHKFRKDMSELRREIIALDTLNTTGMLTEQQDMEIVQAVTAQTRGMEDESAIIVLIDALPKVSPAHRADLQHLLSEHLNSRIQHRRETADSLEDIEALRHDNLLLIRYCVPKKQQSFATDRVNAWFHDPQLLLEELRHERAERLKHKK